MAGAGIADRSRIHTVILTDRKEYTVDLRAISSSLAIDVNLSLKVAYIALIQLIWAAALIVTGRARLETVGRPQARRLSQQHTKSAIAIRSAG
jgi:hypothetical protein